MRAQLVCWEGPHPDPLPAYRERGRSEDRSREGRRRWGRRRSFGLRLGEGGGALGDFVGRGERGGEKFLEGFAGGVDAELGEAGGGFFGEDGEEGDEGGVDGLGGEVEDGIEARGLRGVLGELPGGGGVDVAVGGAGE